MAVLCAMDDCVLCYKTTFSFLKLTETILMLLLYNNTLQWMTVPYAKDHILFPETLERTANSTVIPKQGLANYSSLVKSSLPSVFVQPMS